MVDNSTLVALSFIFLFFFGACLNQNNNHHPAGGGMSNGETGKATPPAKTNSLTYEDILPIFQSSCQDCHNKKSGATLPNWQDYETAKLYKDSLKKRLTEKTMPPTGSALSDQDRRKILEWIDGGALNTPGTQPSPTPEPSPNPPQNPPAPIPAPPPSPPPVDDPAVKIFRESCIGCHGAYAVGLRSPIIFGLPSGYVFNQLQAFKTKNRVDSLMSGAMGDVGASLTDDDMLGLATYVSELSPCLIPESVIDPSQGSVSEGEALALEKGCLGCHNPDNAATFPPLAGQKTLYISQQLLAFKSGERKNRMMSRIASGLGESDILNLAAYLNSLRSCQK